MLIDHKAKRSPRKPQAPRWPKLQAALAVIGIKRLLLGLTALLIVAVVWSRINVDNWLPIASVQIEGEFKYLSREDVQTQAMPHVSGGFFSVNLREIRDALIELPWVEDVSIRRVWPNALAIRVIEKQPVAWWGKTQLLSSKGALFEPQPLVKLDLPVLEGPAGLHETVLQELNFMQTELTSIDMTISRIRVDARRSWTVFMTSGLELRLGRSNQHERLQRMVMVYGEHLQPKIAQIKRIDMRYTNGLAVAWREGQV